MTQPRSHPLLITLLLSTLLITTVRAQNPPTQTLAKASPHVTITIKADGKPVDEKTGAPASTQQVDFAATLDPASRQQFPDVQAAVIKSAWISLVRESKRVGTMYWKAGETITKLTLQAKPGDRYVIEFDLAARQKNGKLVPLAERPVRSFSLR